jgi:HSP20 family protein
MANNIVRFDPFAEIQALQKQFFGDDAFTPFKGLQMPTTDIYTENDKQMTVEAHLPHFADKDVNISVDNDVLEIQAEKHEEEKDKSKKYVVRESSSSFYRRIRLPEQADKEKIEAHMEDGVLKVTVPFKELPAPKKIAIKSKTSKK